MTLSYRNNLRAGVVATLSLLLAGTATAQNAPIRIGPGGSALPPNASDIAMARQFERMAQLESEIQTLTGRVESLEFSLVRATRSLEEAEQTNAALREAVARLESRMDTLGRSGGTVAVSSSPRTGNSPFSDRTAPLNTQRGTGPTVLTPRGSATNSSSERLAGAADDDVAPDRSGARLPSGRVEGSLGTLPASRLPNGSGALFQSGKDRLLAFDYGGAEEAFRAFLDEFEDDPQAGEAYYWLGEVLYQRGAYAESARFFTTMLQSFPKDPRRAEGVVKLARSLREMGETERACAFLGRLTQIDPNASNVVKNTARLERQRSNC